MAVTVTATPEPLNVPPRVRLDVLSTGTATDEVTVGRLDPDGRSVPVRTGDGGPLQLTVDGSDMVGLLYDYGMPYSAELQYGTNEGGLTSGFVTVDVSVPWLVHPGVPDLSQPLDVASLGSRSRPVQRGVFYPLNRKSPVTITDGRRKSAESSIELRTYTLAQLEALEQLTSDATVLLLNVPASLGWGVGAEYVSVGDIEETRLIDYAAEQSRYLTLPYVVVDRPAGGSQAERTYVDVLAENSSYNSIVAEYATYLDLLAPTT